MSKFLDVFCELPCLTERSSVLNGLILHKKWFTKADKRYLAQCLQKFIDYNSKNFDFLGVSPLIIGTDQNSSLVFRTSEFIGTIPLVSSDTGKQIGDFVVMPRFTGRDRFEDYIAILNLLGNEISPQVIDTLPLASGKNFRPPLYLEALKYIDSLEVLIKSSWRKFDNVEKITSEPTGQVNWNKYIGNEFKIENRLRFPVKKNVLSEFHKEYSALRYVFDLCQLELLSSNTPQRIKSSITGRLAYIEEKLYSHQPLVVNNINIKSFDNFKVSNCKEHANKILNFNFTTSTAWRVDFSDVFEKFVQYIFKGVVKESGGHLYSNYKVHANSSKCYSWELKHIEPDAIYQKDDIIIFIDAKYKSNLYNRFDKSDKLKEAHRLDLHQILAYSAFSNNATKYGFLCYPSDKIEIKKTTYKNNLSRTSADVYICGIPLRIDSITNVKKAIMDELYNIGL